MNHRESRTIAENGKIRDAVRQNYGEVATSGSSGCGCSSSSCCGPSGLTSESASLAVGYSPDDLQAVPEGANMGLGCGNPLAIAGLKPGEVVLDLGSGGGLDCFLAAAQVGETGRVIGVDMTPEMVSRAQQNAAKGNYSNVEFRLGEIENLPLEDNTVDVIISNCVINLSPDKPRVFEEAYRVLKPGGRLAISDVIAVADIPEDIRADLAMHTQCIAGASTLSEIQGMLQSAGFEQVQVTPQDESRSYMWEWVPGTPTTDYVVSALIQARKPAAASADVETQQPAADCSCSTQCGHSCCRMEIKVVGSGCASCKRLLELVKDAVGQLGVQADVFYVTDIEEIMATGIIQLPGLVVDAKIKTTGRVPSLKELKQMIQDEM